MGPPPPVAAVRRAVRAALADLAPGETVLVACSGGADSLALAAAVAFVGPRAGLAAGAVTVDHGLRPDSAAVAARVAATLRSLDLDPVETVRVSVGRAGGPEAAARAARYSALAAAADRLGAAAVLLGHTRDDQAETVLLGLARGSGARSLAGMAPRSGRYRRPLLDLDRATTASACAALGLTPWSDPHNADPSFARTRVRHQALPALEAALGPGVAAALARTAALARADADALDAWAASAYEDARTTAPVGEDARTTAPGGADPRVALGVAPGVPLDVAVLRRLPEAVRTRVLRRAAIAAGCPAGSVALIHVRALDALVTAWRGQRHIELPGGVRGFRRYGRLLLVGASAPPREPPPVPPGQPTAAPVPAGTAERDRRGREGYGVEPGPGPHLRRAAPGQDR